MSDPFVDLVRIAVRSQALADPDRRIRIDRAALGDDAGILGAVLLFGPGSTSVQARYHVRMAITGTMNV